jgi:hypothetical protein
MDAITHARNLAARATQPRRIDRRGRSSDHVLFDLEPCRPPRVNVTQSTNTHAAMIGTTFYTTSAATWHYWVSRWFGGRGGA